MVMVHVPSVGPPLCASSHVPPGIASPTPPAASHAIVLGTSLIKAMSPVPLKRPAATKLTTVAVPASIVVVVVEVTVAPLAAGPETAMVWRFTACLFVAVLPKK